MDKMEKIEKKKASSSTTLNVQRDAVDAVVHGHNAKSGQIKRKYSSNHTETQPRKRRKLTDDKIATATTIQQQQQSKDSESTKKVDDDDPRIKALIEERDRKLRLYAFTDYESYEDH